MVTACTWQEEDDVCISITSNAYILAAYSIGLPVQIF